MYMQLSILILILLSYYIDCNINIKNADDDDGYENENDTNTPGDMVMDGMFKCANTIKRTCNLQSKPRMNETLSCLQDNFKVLQKDCMKVFNGLFRDVLESCALDLLTQCQTEAATLSPSEGVSCLFKHYSIVSSSCRAQLDSLVSYAVPCGTEAATYCSDKNNPQDIFDCLSTAKKVNPSDNFDPVCSNAILGYQNCLPKPDTGDFKNNDDRNTYLNKVVNFDDDDDAEGSYNNQPTIDDENNNNNTSDNDDDTIGSWFSNNSGVEDDDSLTDENNSYDGYHNDDSNDEYAPTSQPKLKPKPKPKAKPNPNGGGGKSKPQQSSTRKIQEKPLKPVMKVIALTTKETNIISSERKLQTGGPKSKPKPKPSPSGGGNGAEKPCWVVDDKLTAGQKNMNDDNINANSTNNFERGGLIAFIGFVFSLSILGAMIYLWCKNGRSFANLTVQRAAEIVSEKDPYEAGYAPTAADDHDEEGPNNRMLEPESNGAIEMSDLNISSGNNGYSKLNINEEGNV